MLPGVPTWAFWGWLLFLLLLVEHSATAANAAARDRSKTASRAPRGLGIMRSRTSLAVDMAPTAPPMVRKGNRMAPVVVLDAGVAPGVGRFVMGSLVIWWGCLVAGSNGDSSRRGEDLCELTWLLTAGGRSWRDNASAPGLDSWFRTELLPQRTFITEVGEFTVLRLLETCCPTSRVLLTWLLPPGVAPPTKARIKLGSKERRRRSIPFDSPAELPKKSSPPRMGPPPSASPCIISIPMLPLPRPSPSKEEKSERPSPANVTIPDALPAAC